MQILAPPSTGQGSALLSYSLIIESGLEGLFEQNKDGKFINDIQMRVGAHQVDLLQRMQRPDILRERLMLWR